MTLWPQVVQYIKDGNVLECPENTPKSVYKLMTMCWSGSPANRPCFRSTQWIFSLMSLFKAWSSVINIMVTPGPCTESWIQSRGRLSWYRSTCSHRDQRLSRQNLSCDLENLENKPYLTLSWVKVFCLNLLHQTNQIKIEYFGFLGIYVSLVSDPYQLIKPKPAFS